MVADDFIIIVLDKTQKKLIQAEADKNHSSLSHLCLNAVLKKIKPKK